MMADGVALASLLSPLEHVPTLLASCNTSQESPQVRGTAVASRENNNSTVYYYGGERTMGPSLVVPSLVVCTWTLESWSRGVVESWTDQVDRPGVEHLR